MWVRAIRVGYYGDKRRPAGEVFELVPIPNGAEMVMPDKQFSTNWMEEVDPETHKPLKARPAVAAQPKIQTSVPTGVPVRVGEATGTPEPGVAAPTEDAPTGDQTLI